MSYLQRNGATLDQLATINEFNDKLASASMSKPLQESVSVRPDLSKSISYLIVIEGNTLKGTTVLSVSDILWFEVERKSYYAITSQETYQIKKTIAELEQELNPEYFFRINRSQLININVILNYSYWEFEKYIIRLKGHEDKDFIITRKRFKQLKIVLEKAKQLPQLFAS